MPFPSPSRMEAFLKPYQGRRGLAVRVWAVDAGEHPASPPSLESQVFGHPPRLVLLAGSEEGLVVVRQTHDGMQDLDGFRVPWSAVTRLDRDPHLARDLVRIEVAGRAPFSVAVSNHVLLPHNRASAKTLCDLLRPPVREAPPLVESDGPVGLAAHPI